MLGRVSLPAPGVMMEKWLQEVNQTGRCVGRAHLSLGCFDGSLNIWNMNSNFARPNYSNETAHSRNTEITGVSFAQDGRRVASRAGDDTVKRAYERFFVSVG